LTGIKIITEKHNRGWQIIIYLLIPFDICQVWFQNQRAKMKKIQKKARQENKNKDDECSDDKSQKTKVKEEEQSKKQICIPVNK
jgi:hypothetical protein